MVIEWNAENAAHLLRRAGFAATPNEIKAATKVGLDKTLKNLFKPDGKSDAWPGKHPPESLGQIQGRWVRRMLATSSPLTEKLTVFWHNHFATAISKVENAALMWKQNRTLRKRGQGRFRDLLLAMAQDPAMILWLDNDTNVAEDPNENFARELMELFSTGVLDESGDPNYTEEDIQESARAFTGWTIGGDWPDYDFFFAEWDHDFGSKTFKGHTGAFDGGDIVDILAGDPATARRIPQKLWSYFAYDVDLADPIVTELASVYVANDTLVSAVLDAIFRHDAFYSPAAKDARIKSPVEFYVGSLHLLGADLPAKNDPWDQAGNRTDLLGQELMNPPSVFGWKEGLKWVETAGLLERLKLASDIATARDDDSLFAWKLEKFLGKAKKFDALDATAFLDFVLEKLGPLVLAQSSRDALVAYLLADGGVGEPGQLDLTNKHVLDAKVRGLLAVAMALPEFQRH